MIDSAKHSPLMTTTAGRSSNFTRPGWNHGVFVWPDGGSCAADGVGAAVRFHPEIAQYRPKSEIWGDLREWRRVAGAARGNTPMTLGIAQGFVGPVLDLLGADAPMIQLVGTRGPATVIAKLSVSTWGGSDFGAFANSWIDEANNLERIAGAYNESLLVLNETRAADVPYPRSLTLLLLDVFKRLAKGKTPLLITSSLCLDALAIAAGVPLDDMVRHTVIDVPLDAFDDLHGPDHPKSAQLLRIARCNYALAANLLIHKLVDCRAKDEKKLVASLRAASDFYLDLAPKCATSPLRDVTWVNQRFATIFAAACLAIKFGILPWKVEELATALIKCELAHISLVDPFRSADPAPDA
jgi:hypothetical protein